MSCFPLWYIFECCSEWIEVYFGLRCFFNVFSFPCCLSIQFCVMFPLFPYFDPKLFCFSIFRLFGCVGAFIPYLLVELLSLFWNVLFFLYYIILSQYLSSLPSFASTVRFISSSCIFCFNWCITFCFSSLLAFLPFFLPVLADGLPTEFERKLGSSSLQGRS